MDNSIPQEDVSSVPGERRSHGRLAFSTSAALVISDETVLNGRTADISFRGAKLTLDAPPRAPLPDHCRLMIALDPQAETVIDVHAKVERINHNTVSLQFFSTDIRSYNNLRNLLLLRSRRREQLLQELTRHPGVAVA